MTDLQHEVWDQLGKQAARAVRQLDPTLGQPKLSFVMTPQEQGNQEKMQELKRRKLLFVDDLLVPEHLLGGFPRPIEVLDCPMDEDALARLGLGQADGAMRSRVMKCQQCASQKRRMREVRMVIGGREIRSWQDAATDYRAAPSVPR